MARATARAAARATARAAKAKLWFALGCCMRCGCSMRCGCGLGLGTYNVRRRSRSTVAGSASADELPSAGVEGVVQREGLLLKDTDWGLGPRSACLLR